MDRCMRSSALALSATALAVIAGALVACSDAPSPERRMSSETAARLLLRGNGAEPDSLDPQRARSNESHTVLRDLCEGLTTLAKDASPAPGVAREWSVSPD